MKKEKKKKSEFVSMFSSKQGPKILSAKDELFRMRNQIKSNERELDEINYDLLHGTWESSKKIRELWTKRDYFTDHLKE